MRVTIELTEGQAAALGVLLERANESAAEGHCSHGRLDLPKLAAMLLEDAALAVRRPGSWEGAGMARVLASHGYSV